MLNALVQLGALRLDCDRAFLSLIDDQHQYIISEMTRSYPLNAHSDGVDGPFLGCCKLEPEYGVCPLTMQTFMGQSTQQGPNVVANKSRYVINDFRSIPSFANRPYVAGHPYMVSYLEVPIISPLGYVLGGYCVVDSRQRDFNNDATVATMTEMASAIMQYLDVAMTKQRLTRAENLITGLSAYAAGSTPLLSESSKVDQAFTPNEASSTSKIATIAGSTTSLSDQSESSSAISVNTESISISALAEPPANSTGSVSNDNRSTEAGLESSFAALDTEKTTSPLKVSKSILLINPRKPHNQWQTYIDAHLALLAEAAQITREALDLDGLLFMDAVPSKSNARPIIQHNASFSSSVPVYAAPGHPPPQPISKTLAQSISGAKDRAHIAGPVDEIPDALIQRLIKYYPQGTIFTADERGPIPDAFAPGLKLGPDHEHEHEQMNQKSDGHALFHFLPQARYILFVPLWHFQRECWFTAMLGWSTGTTQAMDIRDVHLLGAFGNTVVSKVAFLEAQTIDQVKSRFISSISHESRRYVITASNPLDSAAYRYIIFDGTPNIELASTLDEHFRTLSGYASDH